MVELHILPPALSAQNISRTLATSFEAIHGFTDQYPVELGLHLQAAFEAGLEFEPKCQTKFPASDLATISINLFTPAKVY